MTRQHIIGLPPATVTASEGPLVILGRRLARWVSIPTIFVS